MATSSVEAGDGLNCAICFQPYCVPRKLPGCSHSFCESCIVKLVLDLRKEDKPGNEFECPVCRLPSCSPGKDDVVNRWVETLEEDQELKSKIPIAVTAELTKNCCGHCLSQDKTVASDKYCLTCHEHYCNSCSQTVHAFRINKNHILIASDKEEDPGFHQQALKMLDGFSACSRHPEDPVMFYCEVDKTYYCATCSIDFHKDCINIKPISSLMEQNLKELPVKFLDLISKLMKHIDTVAVEFRENNDENKKKFEQIDKEYQDMKQKVINVLDIMEENLKQEGKAAIKNAALKNQDEIDDLNIHKSTLKTVQYLLEKLIDHISPAQAFVCLREIEQTIENIERKIIEKGDVVKTDGIELTTTEAFHLIQNIAPNQTAQLASVTKEVAYIFLPTYEDRPFLRKFSVQKAKSYKLIPKDPNNKLSKNDQKITPTYSGLHFLPENRFLLVDSYYGFCCIVDEGFFPSNQWRKFVEPCDSKNSFSNERHATYLGHGIIAVSIPSQKIIFFVTSDGQFTSKGEINCEYEPKALCHVGNGDIAVAWDKPVAFGIISNQVWNCQKKVIHGKGSQGSPALSYCEKVYFTKDKSGRQLKSFRNMAVDEKRRHVIQPCDVDDVVYCFDMDGNAVFRYSSEDLASPGGVALDSDGNVYMNFSLIHIISPEGISITVIGGCPWCPLAIGFNKEKNMFAVTESDEPYDTVHFFSVVRK